MSTTNQKRNPLSQHQAQRKQDTNEDNSALVYDIAPVRTAKDLTTVISLFTDYARSLNLDLSFQDFQTEMATMPGKYSPSAGGELILARTRSSHSPSSSASSEEVPETSTPPANDGASASSSTPLGCVALRSLSSSTSSAFPLPLPSSVPDAENAPKICEMKRLYVVPGARGLGLGRALAAHVIKVARELGYDEIRLDTLPSMAAAQAMYRDLGFVDLAPYCFNPVEGTKFLGLQLTRPS